MTTRKARTRMTALIITVAAGLTTLGGTVVGSAAAGAATPAAVSTVPSGSYTAQPQGNSWSFTFYVSSNRKQIQDIASPSAYLYCTPGSAVAVPFSMASLPLRANGTFGGTSTVKGVYGSYPATYTYTFAGTVRRADSKGPARGAGTFRATLVYTDNVKHTCTSKSTTSNTTGWTATRDKQFTQTTARPPSGSYTAQPQGNSWSFAFFVSASRTQIQDIASPSAYLYCTGGSAISVPFSMASIPLAANGSFSGTSVQHGVFKSYPATFTYSYQGNFHGADNNKKPRAAGAFRETVVYSDSAQHTCTSNTMSWTATRDNQLTQVAGLPPAGSYSGQPQGNSWSFTFSVPAGRTQLQNVASPSAYLYCTGGSAISVPFTMASIPLAANGSFSGTTSSSSPYQGHPATFTYSLSGHFHGVDNNGVARAAGQIRATVVYTDSAPHTCTSNTMAWAGKRTGS